MLNYIQRESHHIISPQADDKLCLVKFFKKYIALLHHEFPTLFQYLKKEVKMVGNILIGLTSMQYVKSE